MNTIINAKPIKVMKMGIRYTNEKSLIAETSLTKGKWLFGIVKELMDNACDAIEPLSQKEIHIVLTNNSIGVFDNGPGLNQQTLNKIYDFDSVVSSNRLIRTASRGQQGNGLKTVIGMVYCLNAYIVWYTSDGAFRAKTNVELDELHTTFEQIEDDNRKRGILIRGLAIDENVRTRLFNIVRRYSTVNNDICFYCKCGDKTYTIKSTGDPTCKGHATNISFYAFAQYMDLIASEARDNPGESYRQFVDRIFGTTLANVKPAVKTKLSDINDNENIANIRKNFFAMQEKQKKRPFTVLRQNLQWNGEKDKVLSCFDSRSAVPMIVEIKIERIDSMYYKKGSLQCGVFVNNSITLYNSRAVRFEKSEYGIGPRKAVEAASLAELLSKYDDYRFLFHFISPGISYADPGKTFFDISGIMNDFIPDLKARLNRAINKNRGTADGTINIRNVIRQHIDEAFIKVTSNLRYAVTVRQLYYKVRELGQFAESDSTYRDFSQQIVTEWINRHPEYERLLLFSDRGVLYYNGQRRGIGTLTAFDVRDAEEKAGDTVRIGGVVHSEGAIETDFHLNHRYDKVLYIEKTGFDDLFLEEGIHDKYHMLIMSGQGFGTRAAKSILKTCADEGITIYCMHDLDISGINIIKALREENEKFKHPLKVIDLGLTIEDIEYYSIVPEKVVKAKSQNEDIKKINGIHDKKLREFFYRNGDIYRAELSALSTEQILDLIDRKIGNIDNRKTALLEKTVTINEDDLKKIALMNLALKKYGHVLEDIDLSLDFTRYNQMPMTYDDLISETKRLQTDLIAQCEAKIEELLE